ncbi:acetyl-CoA synthetase-like protein, partial [Coniochaeta ligniaria NRRL 30616]
MCDARASKNTTKGLTEFHIVYDTQSLQEVQVLSTAHTLVKALDSIIQCSSSTKLNELDIISKHDTDLFFAWNGEQMPVVEDCVHELVEKQVARTPNEEAVCAWDGSFTYRQVSELSDRLAAHLRDSGVGPGVLVPLCFDKSKWYPVANLAVLKAGGACTAIDPTHPPGRIQSILDATRATVVVTEPKHEKLFSSSELVVVSVPRAVHTVPLRLEKGVPRRAKPHDTAFVVFTSGSTGVPKGIIQSHASYASSIAATTPIFAAPPRPRRRHLQFAAHTFDNCLSDMFVTLSTGGCVCIPSEQQRLDDLEGAITALRANQAELTPTVAGLLRPDKVAATLDTLALTGENATPAVIEAWAGRVDRLLNIYGPAEATILTTVKDNLSHNTHPLDIGRPVGGHAWIVDPQNADRLVPLGSVGELLLQGPYVSDGYLGQSKKTSLAFIPPPKWAVSMTHAHYGSGRFYRTGDLARYNPDGSIRLIGRNDTQIKIRGQRVELAGIEHHISACEQVRHAAVVFPSSGPWRKSLVAVIVLSQSRLIAEPAQSPSGAGRPTPSIRLLARNLPVYMLPSMWLVVESIPLLSSGKLDRKLLKSFVESMSNSEAEKARQSFLGNAKVKRGPATDARPMSRAEQIIVESCAHVLNVPVENIDVNDSFLRLGGDSISAMALRARCSEARVSFSVQDVIGSTSLVELAANAKEAAAPEEARQPKFQEDTSPFLLSPIQRLFFESCPDGNNDYSQSILLSSRIPIDPRQLDVGAQILVKRHSMLRARFHRDETQGDWRQSIMPYSASSYGFSTHRFGKISSLPRILAGIRNCLNITEGPVFHMALFEYPGSDRPLVFLTAHHLVIDLVSFRVLLKDLEAIMRRISEDPRLVEQEAPSDKMPLSFQLWSQIQQETEAVSSGSQSNENDGDSFSFAEFWGMTGKPNVFADVETARFDVPEATTRLLLGNSNTAMATRPTDILSGVLIHAFRQTFPERSTPTFLCESHGREGSPSSPTPDLDWSGTVGWFTAMFPVTLTDHDSDDIIQAIICTKDMRQCAFPDHGRAWFAREALRDPTGLLARTEVIFNYFGQYQQLERRDALFAPFTLLGTQPTEEGGPTMVRPALLELALSVSFGKLQVALSYSRRMRHQDRLRAWMATAEVQMGQVAEQLAAAPRRLTLADVPLFRGGYRGLRALAEGTLAAIGVAEADVEDVLPLGPLQRGVLMSRLRQPESDWYDIRWYFKVRSLSALGLQEAWRAVVRRHPALRTVLLDNFDFDGHDGLGQVVLRSIKPQIDSATVEDDSAAERLLRERSKMPFVVPGQPLHRLTVCSSDETDTLHCCLSINHAIVDGTSLGILIRDLAAAGGGAAFVPRSVMPWRTYLSYLQSTSSDAAADFWKGYVNDLVPCILPATARPTVFHAAWALVLQSYASTKAPCFGYLSSGRHLPVQGIHDAVGPFVNTLVLRANIGPDTTGLDLIKSIQGDMHKSMDHQTFPLGKVQQLALGTSSTPLFNTVLSQEVLWEQDSTDEAVEHRPRVEFQEVYDPTEYDLVLHIWNTAAGLSVEFSYWDSKFDHNHVVSIGQTFMTVLAGLTAQPSTAVKHLPRCSDHDLKQIQAWQEARQTTTPNPEACVHDLISEAASKHPDAPAVCAWDGELTMAQLEAWSSRLATDLLADGLVPETASPGGKFVALCFSKGLLHTVAMLAALKTGAAVVSLEPSHPLERLRGMIDDVDAVLVLCSSEHQGLCRDVAGGRSIEIVSPSPLHADPNPIAGGTRPHRHASPSDPAYVIFTSGSTGRPKGVVTEHSALASNLLAQRQALRLGPDTRALQFASYAFDAHILESLAVLAAGGCVCVPAERDRLDDLAGAVRRLRANWALLTPTVAGILAPEDFPGLKVLLSGGEAMTPAVLNRWADRVHLINSYGPSEASVVSVVNARVTRDTEPANIGFGCGPKTWIADPADHGRLVPIGAVGELLLEGRALAREYLRNPAKTSEAFIFDPAWTESMKEQDPKPKDQPRRRFYATGDLVRYTSEGHLIYLGRKDTQVKIHGQRVEMDEIEHHLLQCPRVRQGAI